MVAACVGHPGRAERIYGAYEKTDCGNRSAFSLPDSCSLPVSVGGVLALSQPAIEEDGDNPASGEDLAVTHRLPEAYHGVLVQRHIGRKILTLKAAFMDPSFEPITSSNPPHKQLEKWWPAVSKRIRDSYDHKAIPADLRAAMKGVPVRGR